MNKRNFVENKSHIYNWLVFACGLQEFYAVLMNYSGQVENPDPFSAWNVYDTYLCEVSLVQ